MPVSCVQPVGVNRCRWRQGDVSRRPVGGQLQRDFGARGAALRPHPDARRVAGCRWSTGRSRLWLGPFHDAVRPVCNSERVPPWTGLVWSREAPGAEDGPTGRATFHIAVRQ